MRTGLIGGRLGYQLLKRLVPTPNPDGPCTGGRYERENKLEVLFGRGIWDRIQGKTIVDFGCGFGHEAIDLVRHGARRAIGLDIRPWVLAEARRAAKQAGVGDRCAFVMHTKEPADLVLSIDAFEHFSDPGAVLDSMSRVIRPDGRALIAFGPPWFHPLGGHLFSAFPWAHLLFTEKALIRWRSDFKHDGATRFGEVEGGLNQMTIRRFRRLVRDSAFEVVALEPQPIRRLRALSTPLTREFFTSIVRCELVPKARRHAPSPTEGFPECAAS